MALQGSNPYAPLKGKTFLMMCNAPRKGGPLHTDSMQICIIF